MTHSNRSFRCAALMFLLLLSACLTALSQTPTATLEGSWQGTLGGQLRLVLTFTKSGSGEYKGILDSLDQGATIPADKVTLNGEKLHVDFERVNGFYEGTINQDGSEIAGTWTQNNVKQPLAFKRSQASATAKDQGKP